jgi:hypothetical protein
MLRVAQLLVLALLPALGTASPAAALTSKTALTAAAKISRHRVTLEHSQHREQHQQSALGYDENASDSPLATRAGVETVQRAMSRAELAAMRSTGLVRGGRQGTHFVSDAVNSTATRAQSRLALPTRPEVRVTMEVPAGRFSAPSRVQPYDMGSGRVLPGGGMERTATGDVPARILRVDDL